MNHNLVRQIYYDSDYWLNPQEWKEFHFPRITPYFRARALAFCFNIPICFSLKEQLIEAIDNVFFNADAVSYPKESELNRLYEEDLFSAEQSSLGNIADFLLPGSQKLDILNSVPASLNEQEVNQKLIDQAGKFSIRKESRMAGCPGYQSYRMNIFKFFPELGKKVVFFSRGFSQKPSEPYKYISYAEVYDILFKFTQSSLVFYDLMKNASSSDDQISAVLYVPFTPNLIRFISDEFVVNMSHYFKMHDNPKMSMQVRRQKLVDIFYLIEDSRDFHLVLNCQSRLRECDQIASQYCNNWMCKECCQSTHYREPCIIHDDYFQFFRFKLKETLTFEAKQNFQKQKTLKIIIRRRVKLAELKKVFAAYKVEWDGVKLFCNKTLHRIQAIYLPFKSHQEARKVYSKRIELMEQLKHCDPIIKSLYEDIGSILQPTAQHIQGAFRFKYAPAQLLASVKSIAGENAEAEAQDDAGKGRNNGKGNVTESAAFYQQAIDVPENQYPLLEEIQTSGLYVGTTLNPCYLLAIFVPDTALQISNEIPKKQERIPELAKLIACIMNSNQLRATEFYLIPAVNQITGDKHPDITYVYLPGNLPAIDMIFEAQPYMKYLIAHKLSHLTLLPFLKPVGSNECLICSAEKETESPFDLCSDCLIRQIEIPENLEDFMSEEAQLKRQQLQMEKSDELQIEEQKMNFEEAKKVNCYKCGEQVEKYPENMTFLQPVYRLKVQQGESDEEENFDDQIYLCESCDSVQSAKSMSILSLREQRVLREHYGSFEDGYFQQWAFQFQQELIHTSQRIRFCLREGIYSWYRPIHSTKVEKKMQHANQELMRIFDSDSFSRSKQAQFSRVKGDYQLFSFQELQPYHINCMGVNASFLHNTPYEITEAVDRKGEFFVEYIYDQGTVSSVQNTNGGFDQSLNILGKNKKIYQPTYTEREYQEYTSTPQFKLRENYHVIIPGIEAHNRSKEEIHASLLAELNQNVGTIQPERLKFIDELSVINMLMNEGMQEAATTQFIAIAEFEEILDAIKLVAKEVQLRATSKTVIPSAKLTKFMEEF